MRQHPVWVAVKTGLEGKKVPKCLLSKVSAPLTPGFVVRQRQASRLPEADDQRHRKRTGTQAALLPPTVGQRLERWQLEPTAPGDQSTDALGAIDLVSASADEIDSGIS